MTYQLRLIYDPVPIDCDRCVLPGTCCKAFPLSLNFDRGSTPEQVQARIDAALDEEDRPYPFKVLRRDASSYSAEVRSSPFYPEGYEEERWMFSCTKLLPEGRCGDYENRPVTCRIYEAGSDIMCVHWRGADGHPVVPLLPKE